MATEEYWAWVNAGRPYQVARPILQMAEIARFRGVPVLGVLGDEGHLTSNFPEDHTPFSYTSYPNDNPGYWVTAIDLADVKGWGDAILRDARALALPWLKYMNYGGLHFDWVDGFRHGRYNADQHIHLSCFTNFLHSYIGGYDPSFAPGKPIEVEQMYGPLHKTERPVCIPTPIVALRRRILSLSADFGKVSVRVALASGSGKWRVITGIPVESTLDPWVMDLPNDIVAVSILWLEGDENAAVGWSILYV